MAYPSTLLNPKFKNWVKAGIALNVTKDGIEDYVEKTHKAFYSNVIGKLPAGSVCISCSTGNVVHCRSQNNLCKFSSGACLVHVATNRFKACGMSVCNIIRDEITKKHRYQPNWKNTDARKWCNNSWELAKCYMADGYESKSTAAETDLAGLLSVVTNNKKFQAAVTDSLTNKNNIFCQTREIRNEILHNASMEVEDTKLLDYINTMISMLSDSKYLAPDPRAKKAISILCQIKTDTLTITNEDEIAVREESRKVIAEAIRDIAIEKQKAVTSIQREAKYQTDNAIASIQRGAREMDNSKLLQSMFKELIDLKKELKTQSVKKEGHYAITASKAAAHGIYNTYKADLQSELLVLFMTKYLIGQVVPFTEQHNSDNLKPRKADVLGKVQIKDVFTQHRRNICLSGVAGSGQSISCGNVISAWNNMRWSTHILNDDEMLVDYDFIFYLLLREEKHNTTTIDDIIRRQVIKPFLSEDIKGASQIFFSAILRRERCLIIFDGLGENCLHCLKSISQRD